MKGLILFILMYWIYPSGDKISYTGEYKILPQSKVYLAGTSNVNKFSCDCVHDFENQVFKADAISDGEMDFVNTQMQLAVEYIDCKNRKMDKDLQKALKSDLYPNVKIELSNIKIINTLTPISWNRIQATVLITLAGEKRKYEVDVKAKQSEGKILLTGSKSLRMTEFKIVPPQVLFGMIKVNDEITFHFDLHVELSSKSI